MEAQKRLAATGPNEPAAKHRTSLPVQILLLFANPLVGILLFASFVSAIVGDPINAGIIMIIVVLSVTLNFYQSYRSQQAAERLRAQVTPTATVLRDGAWKGVPRRELVPGDIVRLSAGDMVPADARLIDERDLHIQQAALTGESLPVEKASPRTWTRRRGRPLEARNAVFLGTSVMSGTATALVQSTGSATAFGDIAARLAARPPETEFERGTRQFGLLIMRTVVFLVLFVFLVSAGATSAPARVAALRVALAVGLTPEFLPMITTVRCRRAQCIWRAGKVIVKHLAAIQNFGSIDVLCSDKTGTLTSGQDDAGRQSRPGRDASRQVLCCCAA